MTENEAIKYFRMATDEAGNEEFSDDYKEMCSMEIKAIEKVQAFEAIGTIEEFKALKEKNVAKKPHSISIANDIGNSMVECPICHARSDYDVKSIKRGHCWKCGQKLDWGE